MTTTKYNNNSKEVKVAVSGGNTRRLGWKAITCKNLARISGLQPGAGLEPGSGVWQDQGGVV